MKKTDKKLKIAIVSELLVKMGGAERVVKKLAEMYPDAPIYTLLFDEDKCGRDFSAGRVRASFLQKLPKFMRKRYRWLLTLMPYAIESMNLSEYDLVITSSSAFAHGALTNSESLHVCYCHSPMRYAWDYTHEYLKEKWFNPITGWLAKRALEKIRIWDKIASDRPDVYIANSTHVEARINKYYRLPSKVIYPPVDVKRFDVRAKRGDYFLIVSTLTAYKKIDLAINLFNKVGKKLVIVGDGPEKAFLQSIAGENIEFTGRLSDHEVATKLEGCRALVFPSEEDFGITMVEAMACGRPVLAYGKGGALEIVKAGVSGEFFAEQNLASMEDALGRMLINENKYQPDEIRASVERFSEENFEKHFEELVNTELEKLAKK